ncbi:MAG TPA: chemotaxis protein CheA [Pseudobdellovibrionaceae bacterium]|jgi:two-component system chemotaxis sensor kinase CheA
MDFDMEMITSFCDEALDSLTRWEQVCLELSQGENQDLYQELFRLAHNIKGGSRAVGLIAMGDYVHQVEDGITLLRDGQLKLSEKIIQFLLESHKHLSEWIIEAKTEPAYLPDHQTFLNEFKSFFQQLNAVNSGVSSETSTESRTLSSGVHPEAREMPQPETQTTAKTAVNEKRKAPSNETIRVSAQKLDQLIQVIGELSIHQTIVWHTRGGQENNNKIFTNSLQLSQKLTKELYDRALSLRMQPLQSVFQRLERNIMDLSRSLEKAVKVEISGGEVELDKTVIEKIVDPLMHIVRNAVDHGIERPADRIMDDKPEFGTVAIHARQDTFGVELTIKDNGKGLSSQNIRAKALEKGLISENKKLSEKEIFGLILLPGFSTAEKITDVSGRGVGMDVVKRTLDDLNGSIEIFSEVGKGTQFTVTLPTSVSIIDALLITLSGHNYVLPVGAIEEVINFEEGEMDLSKKMIVHNDHVMPLQDLESLLVAKASRRPTEKTQKKAILVCKHESNKIGFLIDRVVGQQQVVIRPLNENINGSFGLLGGTILGNGEPGLIIDMSALASHFANEFRTKERVA